MHMDPTLRDALEELRQAGAYMPGTLPASGFGAPNLAALPRNASMGTMLGIPPPEEQADVIEQVRAAMASDDPKVRARAQAYMDQYGRNMFMVGLNQATGAPWRGSGQQGFSDRM